VRSVTVSPSDFAFLWQDCPRCWYLKVVGGMRLPRGPMAPIFQKIDRGMKLGFEGRRLDNIGIPGTIVSGEKQVCTRPFPFPELGVSVQVKGKYDSLVLLDDGTYMVVDFKTSLPQPKYVHHYANQLHAYALALEKPAVPNVSPPIHVSSLALIVWTPDGAMCIGDQDVPSALLGAMTAMTVPMDRGAFEEFVRQIAERASLPGPPPPSEYCDQCSFMRDYAHYMRMLREKPNAEPVPA
jgi:hypothetical protein